MFIFVVGISHTLHGKLPAARICKRQVTRTVYTLQTVHLVSQRSQNTRDSGQISRSSSFALKGDLGLLLGVVSLLLDLSLGLQLGDQVSVAPSDLLGQLAQHGEVAVSTQSQSL
jgi:hypothetical protein